MDVIGAGKDESVGKHNACAMFHGVEFQILCAIVIMLDTLAENLTINVEAHHEDFEIQKRDGKRLFFQAKSKMVPYLPLGETSKKNYNHSVKAVLRKALAVFAENNEKIKETLQNVQYVYVCNMQYPFGEDGGRKWDGFMQFQEKELTEQEKQVLTACGKSETLGEMAFICLQVDDAENYSTAMRTVLKEVEKFLTKLSLTGNYCEEYLKSMTALCMHTSSNVRYELSKKHFIANAIQMEMHYNGGLYDREFCDSEISSEELKERYESIIRTFVERYESYTKVISSFNLYEKGKTFRERRTQFAYEYAGQFIAENLSEIDEVYQKDLARYIILQIIDKRHYMNKAENVFS